ncbi:hypothetical protein HZB94_01375 [Candidatus Falkowbacteria bacterium]|nr:hypothetical protein [Candidatus Falkowbacteria bacterium]
MNKFLKITTVFLALIMTNCEPQSRKSREPIQFKPLPPNPAVPRVDQETGKIICPACPPCSADQCSEDEKQNPWNTKCYYAGKTPDRDIPLPPRDFGHGIYFFPIIKQDFAKALAMFLKAHPELRVVTIAEDSVSERNGYFVVFETQLTSTTEEK